MDAKTYRNINSKVAKEESHDNMPYAEIFQVLTHYELSIDFLFPAVLKASDVFPSRENSEQLKEDC